MIIAEQAVLTPPIERVAESFQIPRVAPPYKVYDSVVAGCVNLALSDNPAETFNLPPMEGSSRVATVEHSAPKITSNCRRVAISSRVTSVLLQNQNAKGSWVQLNSAPIRITNLGSYFLSKEVGLKQRVDDRTDNLRAQVTTVLKLKNGETRRACGAITFFSTNTAQEPFITTCRTK